MQKKQRSSLTIFHAYRALAVPRRLLHSVSKKIYQAEKIPPSRHTNLICCSDYCIRRLNARFRRIDRATDVLSFHYGDTDLLGEIYISLQRARIQSRRYGLCYNDEMRRLFVHGMFHLLGYTHDTGAQRMRMENREREFCCLER